MVTATALPSQRRGTFGHGAVPGSASGKGTGRAVCGSSTTPSPWQDIWPHGAGCVSQRPNHDQGSRRQGRGSAWLNIMWLMRSLHEALSCSMLNTNPKQSLKGCFVLITKLLGSESPISQAPYIGTVVNHKFLRQAFVLECAGSAAGPHGKGHRSCGVRCAAG